MIMHRCDDRLFCRLSSWDCETLHGRPAPHAEGAGDVTFTRTDGRKVTFKNVDVDSVSPVATATGVIAFNYFGTDKVVHVPFVESWAFDYRF